jgi:hypothetical protein
MNTLSANTLIEAAKLQENFDDLSSGAGDLVSNSLETTRLLTVADHVASGGVWTGDSYGASLAASMTALIAIIGGKYVTASAVSARAFTASKDTYIDLDDEGTLTYTEVANNAASPALAANSIRIGIIVTGGASIASVASINQGQETKLLPIASSSAYSVTDSLGNLICNRSPQGTLVGYRRMSVSDSTNPTGTYKIPALSTLVVQADGLRKMRFTAQVDFGQRTSSSATYGLVTIKEGGAIVAIGGGQLNGGSAATNNMVPCATSIETPTAGSHTYDVYIQLQVGGNMSINGTTTTGNHIRVELV